MAHQHGQSHLVRRQRHRDEEDDSNVATIISVEIVTQANTNTGKVVWVTEGPKSLIAPAVRSRPSSNNDSAEETPVASSRKTPSSAHAADPTSIKQASTLMVATKAPTPSAGSAAAGIASATASAAVATDAAAAGMSGGAKAGLALGVLVVIGALLVGILVLYRRKKNQMAAANKENEKTELYQAPPPPPPQIHTPEPGPLPAPSIRTERTMSTAPRLSLRPVTQFDPTFNEQRKSAGNLLTVGAAGGAAPNARDRDLPERPSSAWERPGATNAPPVNPFNDPEHHSGPPSANPFGNEAAIDARQAAIPDSPPNASPLQSTQPSNEFASPAPANATTEVDPVAMAGAMHSVPAPIDALPLPPTINANADGVPPSPAWTEDIPASPGPAPTGPPPVAGAIVAGPPNGPGPGPNNVHRVQLDFKASMADELTLQPGQLVRMLHEYDDGWALCIRMDRSQQGVVPRTCLSKHPVKPRTGPPRQGPPPPGMRGPPIRSPMGPGGVPQPRPLSPASGRNSPHPSGLQPASGRNSPAPRSMSPAPRQQSPTQMHGPPQSHGPNPQYASPRGRSNSNAPYAGPPRSMSPGPYGGGPQMAPPPQMGRPRANSASQAGNPRRGPAPGPSPMNPNGNVAPIPARKPVPGMAM